MSNMIQRTFALTLGCIASAVLAQIAVGADEPRRVIPLAQQKSGLAFQSPATRERQLDLTVNPGMLWVEKGAELWSAKAGTAGKSCQDCHGAPQTLKGVAASYPAWDAKQQRMLTLETRIQDCRVRNQGAPAPAAESEPLLALSALVAHQSRGLPMSPSIEGPAHAAFDAGRRLYEQRVGQLNLACTQCHEQNWGRRLRTETVSQGQSNGYPLYRLEWQTLGSLYRRLRSCFNSVRSQPPAHGSPDHVALELYLAWRAKGLPVETPAVRR
jgi:sulfur-oxidizing protein SoxA